MSGSNYLDTCKEASRSIDVEALGARTPGGLVGTAGSGYSFRQLGTLITAGSTKEHVGLKIPRLEEKDTINRVHADIAFIALQIEVTPELTSYFPRFMNLIQVEDSPAMAILMEDVSEGGQKSVWPAPATQRARQMLYLPYAELGDIHEVLEHWNLDRSTSFDVEGQEKLLDLTPPPIALKYLYYSLPLLQKHFEAALEALPEVTITIPQDSILGDALTSSA